MLGVDAVTRNPEEQRVMITGLGRRGISSPPAGSERLPWFSPFGRRSFISPKARALTVSPSVCHRRIPTPVFKLWLAKQDLLRRDLYLFGDEASMNRLSVHSVDV